MHQFIVVHMLLPNISLLQVVFKEWILCVKKTDLLQVL